MENLQRLKDPFTGKDLPDDDRLQAVFLHAQKSINIWKQIIDLSDQLRDLGHKVVIDVDYQPYSTQKEIL